MSVGWISGPPDRAQGAGYNKLRRDLLLAVHPDIFGNIAGSTDSEVLFHLALTFGLTDDPIAGIARMAGLSKQPPPPPACMSPRSR